MLLMPLIVCVTIFNQWYHLLINLLANQLIMGLIPKAEDALHYNLRALLPNELQNA